MNLSSVRPVSDAELAPVLALLEAAGVCFEFIPLARPSPTVSASPAGALSPPQAVPAGTPFIAPSDPDGAAAHRVPSNIRRSHLLAPRKGSGAHMGGKLAVALPAAEQAFSVADQPLRLLTANDSADGGSSGSLNRGVLRLVHVGNLTPKRVGVTVTVSGAIT